MFFFVFFLPFLVVLIVFLFFRVVFFLFSFGCFLVVFSQKNTFLITIGPLVKMECKYTHKNFHLSFINNNNSEIST